MRDAHENVAAAEVAQRSEPQRGVAPTLIQTGHCDVCLWVVLWPYSWTSNTATAFDHCSYTFKAMESYIMIKQKSSRAVSSFCFFVFTLTLSPWVASQPTGPEWTREGTSIYQTDAVGNKRSNLPSWSVQADGRVVETNPYGETMHHKQQYRIVGDRSTQPSGLQGIQQETRIYQTDSIGNIRSNLPSWTVQSDGRVVETNQYGEKMHHKQQYRIVGDRLMPIDSVGNPQSHKGTLTRR